jgi:hypothetical protein
MSQEIPGVPAPRISFERLRERTDELELLVSGLIMFALFAVPGWLVERYMAAYWLLPLAAIAAANMGVVMAIGLAWVLGALFAVHIGIRAYWVGLIGLKSVFPEGIRWERIAGLGPIGRAQWRERIPSIDAAIEAADRAASTLFAVITFGALASLWAALVLSALFALAALVGGWLGATNAALALVGQVLLALLLGAMLLSWLLDAVLARRFPALQESRSYRHLVALLRGVSGVLLPNRLLRPVQLTLQSNTRPWLFHLLFLGAMALVPLVGMRYFQSAIAFDTSSEQRVINFSALPALAHGKYYESTRVPRDRFRPGPLIPAPVESTRWLVLFLPYLPLIDDPLLAANCPDPTGAAATRCLARLWRVRLNGREVALDGFVPMQRNDLELRGLQGWVSLAGVAPGPQRLAVTWRPAGLTAAHADDWLPPTIEHEIPFLFAPQASE